LDRIRDKTLFQKSAYSSLFPFFAKEKCLNGHSYRNKQQIAMHLAPLDSSSQGASFEMKELYLGLFIFEKIAKN
jgi:hypothetical protein